MFLVIALFCNLTVLAQLQLEDSGKAKSLSKYEKEASYIKWMEDGYYYRVTDYDCAKYHLFGEDFVVAIYLGQNAKEVKESGLMLQNWFKSAKNDEFVYTTNKNGRKICIYKFNSNIYFSNGSEVECKATRIQFGLDMTAAIAGGLNGQANAHTSKKQRDELMANVEFGTRILTGVCSFKKDFVKSIENFVEPGQVNDDYKKTIIAEMPKIKQLYSDNGLLESVIYLTYKDHANKMINSIQEEDWKNLEKLQNMLKSLAKSKVTSSLAEIETELEAVETLEEKIEILLNY